MIFDIDSLENVNIKIKKPFVYGNVALFDIYTQGNQNFYLQSPSMIIPYIVQQDSMYSFNICEYKCNKYTNKIENIINKIINEIKNNYPQYFKKEKVYKKFIYEEQRFPKIFQFRNIKIKNIALYNIYKENLSFEDISLYDMVTIIYQVKNIWINDISYGLNIDLIQLRKDNCVNKEYMFVDNEQKVKQYVKKKILEEITPKLPVTEAIKIRPKLDLKEMLEKRKSILKVMESK